MKTWITVLCAAAVLVGCVTNDAVVDGDQLRFRDGLYTFKGEPFTGVAAEKHENGQKQYEGTWKDGKQHGLWRWWDENGQKVSEVTFKNFKAHGLGTTWHKNGQKRSEATFKDGIQISEKKWDENGKPLGQEREVDATKPDIEASPVDVDAPKVVVDWNQLERRDGRSYFEENPFTGVAVAKYPNGQKKAEVTLKDGEYHGPGTYWYENGQKKRKSTYKDGYRISDKRWDENGNPE